VSTEQDTTLADLLERRCSNVLNRCFKSGVSSGDSLAAFTGVSKLQLWWLDKGGINEPPQVVSGNTILEF